MAWQRSKVLHRVAGQLVPTAVADRVVEELRGRLTGYANLAGRASLDEVHRVAARNVEMFLDRLLEGRGPGEDELEQLRASARHRATEGLPLEQMLQAYRIGTQVAWAMLLELAADDDEHQALLGSVEVLLEHVDTVSSLVERTYLDAREELVSESERRARQALDLLTSGSDLAPEDRELVRGVGVPLQPTYTVFALVAPGGSVVRHAQLAAWIRASGRGVAVTEGDRVSGLAWQQLCVDDLDLAVRDVLAVAPDVMVEQLQGARADVRLLADLAVDRGLAGRVRVQDHLLRLLVAGAPRLGQVLADQVLAPLAEAGQVDLQETLVQLVDHDFDRRRTAQALYLHRNTLAYRMSRIEQLTGMDLRSVHDVAKVYLAMAFVQMHKVG